jgi:hypothetical protein
MMNKLILSLLLVQYFAFPVYALDDTDESWRKMDPALGIETVVRSQIPNPPIFDAHFTGSGEKEFILYEWEPEICNVSFMGWCLWSGRPRWKRIRGISSHRVDVTGEGNVDCQARVVLTSWYRMSSTSTWVQVKTNIESFIPYKPSVSSYDRSIGVIARFEDEGGGYGTVEFIYGCNPIGF